ncbi:histidine kinase [Clostridium sp. 1001275B_160808_H3]|uniref:sensor histidine kinase n=1 Tax=Clostridium sp. 1001275B_160808_H3 TaxID=2787110 RepID=UPI00189972D1|nr:histidine kinase [Clostridium sp. 1001275B_160808_H3]
MKVKNFFNYCSIKSKLLIIYIFCVLIPVIITNSLMLYTVRNNEEKEQKINIDHVIDRVTYNLNGVIAECMMLSNHINSDEDLNTIISTEYKLPVDYYDKYFDLLRNTAIKDYYNPQHIYRINIYVENDSIINSANIFKLSSEVKNKEWYKQYRNNNESTTITVEYDADRKLFADNSPCRNISVVRKLDYFKDGREKIVKIDINYDALLGNILNEQMNEGLYIVNNDLILLSNKGIYSPKEDFKKMGIINASDILVHEKLKLSESKNDWKIIFTEEDESIFINLKDSGKLFISLIIFNLVLPTIIISLISKSLGNRVKLINTYLGKVKNEEFYVIDSVEGNDEIGSLIKSYNLMVLKIKELIEVVFKEDAEKKILQLAKKQAELNALQSQINPHFMFNTLETIRMRSLIKKEDETAEIIEKLSMLLRRTINWGNDNITIEEEMMFVNNYIDIQRYRFGEKLSYNCYIMEDCKKYKIPKLSLLTFVENSCVHGIERISYNAGVSVSIFKDEKYLYMEISDTGEGMSEDLLQRIRKRIEEFKFDLLSEEKSIGIFNAYMRMKMYFNNNMYFEIESAEQEGTDITIKISMEEF